MDKMEKHVVAAQNFSASVLLFDQLDLCAIFLSGPFETAAAMQLRAKVNALTAGKRFNFIVDLDGLSYISSTGLGFLVYLAKNKRDFVYLSRLKPAIKTPFDLLGIEKLFRFYTHIYDLDKAPEVPKQALSAIWVEKQEMLSARHQRRWLDILKDYLSEEGLAREIQELSPYLAAANQDKAITLPAQLKYASVLYKFLDRALSPESGYRGEPIDDALIEMAAKELMTNAIRHGYDNRPGGMVEVSFSAEPDRLIVTFSDNGQGYAMSQPEDYALPPSGLELLRKIFDEVTISAADREKPAGLVLGRGTMIRMIKRFPPETEKMPASKPGLWQKLGLKFKGRTAR